MPLWKRWEVLDAAQAAAELFFEERGIQPALLDDENLPTFFAEARHALRLIAREPEVILFAVLQWATFAVAYMMWIGIFGWVPAYWYWTTVDAGSSASIALAFGSVALAIAWTILVVALAAWPVSLFNAAMVAAHFLRQAGQHSTVWRCLILGAHSTGRVWLFTLADSQRTIVGFLNRLPERRLFTLGFPFELRNHTHHYAWKIGTMAILPALVAGRDYRAAAKDSLSLLYARPDRTVHTRMGYALLCGVFGTTTFLLAPIILLLLAPSSWPYRSLVVSAGTFLLTFGVITLLLRPIFLLIVASHYTEAVAIEPASVAAAAARRRNLTKLLPPLAIFLVMATVLLKDEIGFLVDRDLDAWRRQLLGF